jgi:hypothetical protein
VDIIGEQRGARTGLRVDVGVEVLHGLAEGLLGVLVQVAHRDAAGELRVVRVLHRHGGGHLGGEVVELGGGDTIEDAVDHLQGDLGGIHHGIQFVAELLHTGGDLVEFHCLPASVALDHIHASSSVFVGVFLTPRSAPAPVYGWLLGFPWLEGGWVPCVVGVLVSFSRF